MTTEHVDITVWDETGMVADLTGATKASVTEVWNGVADGQLTYPGINPELLAAWARPGRLVLAIDGPMPTRCFIDKLRTAVDGETGLGTELDLAGAASVLDSQVLLPDPDLKVTEQTRDKNTIKGPAAATIEKIITQTVTRTGVPVALAPGTATGTTAGTKKISVEASFNELGPALRDAAEDAGVAVNARIWLPGDDLPDDVSVPVGGVIVTVDAPRERHWVSWQDSDLPSGTVELTGATAAVGVTETKASGGDGDSNGAGGTGGQAASYGTVTDQTAIGQLGQWAGLETKLAATEADEDPADKMTDYRETTAAEAEAPDGGPFYIGTDYVLGDEVVLDIGTVTATAVVTEVDQDIEMGISTLTPTIGDPVLPPDVAVIRKLLKRTRTSTSG